MGQALIVMGDSTSHGGKVITAAHQADTHGKPIARMGDMVSCPRCRGVFPISQGDPSFIIDGAPVAYHGCQVACGAIVLASQFVTSTTSSGGSGGGNEFGSEQGRSSGDRLGSATTGFGPIDAHHQAAYQEQALDDTGQRFQGRFQLLDGQTNKPVQGQSMRLRSTAGQYITGTTDAEGFTPWVERDASEALAFDLYNEAQA